jgi:hypothetical protein
MKYLLIIFLLGITLSAAYNNCYSWDSTAAKYMPLQVGNIWVYNCTAIGMACNCTKRYRFIITHSLSRNGKTYFVSQGSSANINCGFNFCDGPALYADTLRIDSSDGNIYKYSFEGCTYSPFEKMQDSLNAGLDDTVRNNCGISQYRYICRDTLSQNIFGQERSTKTFSETQFETGYGRKYTHGIGLVESGYGSVACGQTSVLIGCVINGVLYGDTAMPVGINQISSEVPQNFSLSQNYPNPFNPTTQIEFKIANSGYVKLAVFDALGREVETLVNQELSPGTYQADFDGSNLPSGAYYYKLESGAFTETKKMVLIK